MGLVEGKAVVITGGARGVGRAHALAFANAGARVVVNDLGCEVDGTGSSVGPAGEVVDEIRAMGGEAVANGDDVADWEGSKRMIDTCIETFGSLDVLVDYGLVLTWGTPVRSEQRALEVFMEARPKWQFVPVVADAQIVCPRSGRRDLLRADFRGPQGEPDEHSRQPRPAR
ncbi:MAG: SDR family NAD(P)-dependent oxidoreductase [Acidimicrobiales bacterium]|nr:SDR family NAD(P)-dependent oxidoreductase [Acidimicrobiales bacterium]